MTLIQKNSLAETLDRVNLRLFEGPAITAEEGRRVARWISLRQGMPGAYAGMFAPTRRDYAAGARLLTGEKVVSGAATGHILGQEACRALLLLGARSREVRSALRRAGHGILERIRGASASRGLPGMFCCGTCSVALWRHLAAGGLVESEAWLARGIKALQQHRNGLGRWRRFPFYYTLLLLSEVESVSAGREIRYTAAACERALRGRPGEGVHGRRRRLLLERILGRV